MRHALPTAQEAFLQQVLSGEAMAASDVDALLDGRVQESLHLDYKSGRISDKAPEVRAGAASNLTAELRRHLVGFANAEGGVLVLGVTEPRDQPNSAGAQRRRWVDGFPGYDSVGLERRLGEAFAKAVPPSLASTIRIRVIEHPDGLVALVAAPRAEGAVWTVEKERVVHYFRLVDQTIQAPDYLVQDLLLGRRQRPEFEVELGGIRELEHQGVHPSIRVRNTGFTWLQSTRCGVVTVCVHGTPFGEPLSSRLSASLRIEPPAPGTTVRVFPLPQRTPPSELVGPFEGAQAASPIPIPFVPLRDGGRWWWAGVYASQLNQPVRWLQLVAHLGPPGHRFAALYDPDDIPVAVGVGEDRPDWVPVDRLRPID